MKGLQRQVLLVALSLLATATALQAQTIAGTVLDPSGAVMPGVTVEASSPILIEKVRTVVTDAERRYSIVDLRPGPYVVVFSQTTTLGSSLGHVLSTLQPRTMRLALQMRF
jgi:hypothetical protein